MAGTKNIVEKLSGGAYLGFYHMGLVKALFSEGLLPRVISGASAERILTLSLQLFCMRKMTADLHH
eukprot:gene25150-31573_t